MARMIPAEPPSSPEAPAKRSAEKRLFELLRRGLGDDWTVLHSLEVARAKEKKWAEIDFVLIGPEGVFCIETKGGDVHRDNGVWYSRNRKGVDFPVRDPYAQAREGFAEMERLVNKGGFVGHRVLVGYGVAFPQCRFREAFREKGWPPDLPESITIDVSATAQEMLSWIDRLETFARGTPGAQGSQRLTSESRQRIVDQLRPDFVAPPALGPHFHEIERDLGEAARLQYKSATGAIRDVDRATILGGPGTGKSVLAIEEAAFQGGLARDGLPVVLACYNYGLAQFLRAQVSARAPQVRVQTLHDLMRDVVAASGLADRLKDEDSLSGEAGRRYFGEELPGLAVEALSNAEEAPVAAKAHALIIDEGQDILREPFVSFIDAFIEGGIERGRWKLFLDRGQDAYKAFDDAAYGLFEAARNASYMLQFNCRNADAVAGAVTVLAGDGVCATEALVPGGSVAWKPFSWKDATDQATQVAEAVDDLLEKGVDLSQIVLLSPYRFEKSLAVQAYTGRLPLIDIGERVPQAEHLAFSTIYKFKGLEADAIILLDVTERLRKRDPAILRVGASRARASLTVMLEEQLHNMIEQAVTDHSADCPNHPGRIDPEN